MYVWEQYNIACPDKIGTILKINMYFKSYSGVHSPLGVKTSLGLHLAKNGSKIQLI